MSSHHHRARRRQHRRIEPTNYQQFARRYHRDLARNPARTDAQRKNFRQRLVHHARNPHNLIAAAQYVQREGGATVGPDGVDIGAFTPAELAQFVASSASAFKDRDFRRLPTSFAVVAKADGGRRKLTLFCARDRVIARALTQILGPYYDFRFSPLSIGFRAGRDRTHGAALAIKLARQEDRWVWVTADIRRAFDRVPRRTLLELLEPDLDWQLRAMIRELIRTRSPVGIPQGLSLSPLLMNLFLDQYLDRPWAAQHPGTPLLRYADDMLLLCRSRDEAEEAVIALGEMLRAVGMPLKSDPGPNIVTLGSRAGAEWLGYLFRRLSAQHVDVSVAPEAWLSLQASLAEAFSPADMKNIIRSWVSQLGPCLGDGNKIAQIAPRIWGMLEQLGLEHRYDCRESEKWFESARRRWGRTFAETQVPGTDLLDS